MDIKQQARTLIEGPAGESELPTKVRVLVDRMTLQLASVPSLLAHWADTSATMLEDGRAKIQFGFLKLPEEALQPLKRLLSLDYFEYRVVRYSKNEQAMTGVEILVSPDDLPGEDSEYAY